MPSCFKGREKTTRKEEEKLIKIDVLQFLVFLKCEKIKSEWWRERERNIYNKYNNYIKWNKKKLLKNNSYCYLLKIFQVNDERI